MMAGKKLPQSPMRPGAPNYGNARGRGAAADNEGIEEENNPGVSPGSIPDPVERTDDAVSGRRDDAKEFQDRNYAQYMNRGDGRYLKLMEDQAKGSLGPSGGHDGDTRRIHRRKSR